MSELFIYYYLFIYTETDHVLYELARKFTWVYLGKTRGVYWDKKKVMGVFTFMKDKERAAVMSFPPKCICCQSARRVSSSPICRLTRALGRSVQSESEITRVSHQLILSVGRQIGLIWGSISVNCIVAILSRPRHDYEMELIG